MEMTPRENMLAILKGEQPQYYGDFQWAVKVMLDPIWKGDMVPQDGEEHKDSWGTTCAFLPGAPGKHPCVTPENAVIKDITRWKQDLTIPSLKDLDWTSVKEAADQVNRDEYFVEFFSAQGLFERSHFLMGMEDAFCAYLEEPDAMFEMLTAIKDYKVAAIKEAAYHIKPDVCFFQDDWGSKQNLFLPPDVWEEMIKPLQVEIANPIHECGMIYVHHADCICEPIAEEMEDLGIDIWQGVIPENDIVGIQGRLQGKMAMLGGINGPALDAIEPTQEDVDKEVRRCIDTYCPGGKFFPGSPAPLLHAKNNEMLQAALRAYGEEWATKHPIA